MTVEKEEARRGASTGAVHCPTLLNNASDEGGLLGLRGGRSEHFELQINSGLCCGQDQMAPRQVERLASQNELLILRCSVRSTIHTSQLMLTIFLPSLNHYRWRGATALPHKPARVPAPARRIVVLYVRLTDVLLGWKHPQGCLPNIRSRACQLI